MSEWIKKVPSINSVKDVFLNNTGIKSTDEANEWYKRFYADEYVIAGMDMAVYLVGTFQDKNILIVGDYDVDGQTSTSILYLGLKALGYNVSYRLPHHFSEGFGINSKIVDEITTSPDETLIITCDNGIAQVEAVNYAKAKGYTVIIIDHHEPEVENGEIILPEADIIIDPIAIKGQCSFDGYCGAGLSFKFIRSLFNGEHGDLLAKLQSLAAVGTIADVMRLVEENYAIVRIALSHMAQAQFCTTGLYALLNATKLITKDITAKDIGFSVSPALNSLTRLHDTGAEIGVKLLTFVEDYDYQEALKIAEYCLSENDKRKELQNELFAKAVKSVEEKYSEDIPIVLYLENAPEGLMGPIAAKICDKYKRPAFVLTDSEYFENILKGSSRAYKYGNYDIKAELDIISESSDLIFRYGGHTRAAGLSVEKKNLDNLRKALNANATNYVLDEKIYYDLDINVEDIGSAIDEVKKYGPYGEGNPEPVFRIRNFISCKDPRKNEFIVFMGKTGKSVKIFGNGVNAVNFFNAEDVAKLISEHPDIISAPVEFDMIGTLSNNEFKGFITRQIEFSEIKLKKGTP